MTHRVLMRWCQDHMEKATTASGDVPSMGVVMLCLHTQSANLSAISLLHWLTVSVLREGSTPFLYPTPRLLPRGNPINGAVEASSSGSVWKLSRLLKSA
ncbi:unnamed protein product [Protopolystoma xenopodis]|uniref:Uncharacterized protein n=1 Tax=Protopolystoma xenopodis TaxID=117903 RepID=A0A448XA52_9PLAT|nr:unnamed protein product [Protopolystoma xenopodis]